MAAKRARQINAYYSQLGEGLLEYVGPAGRDAQRRRSRCPSRCARSSEGHADRRGDGESLTGDGTLADASRVILGVSARASPRTRPASCCGGSDRIRASGPGRADPGLAACFVGAATWAALSGQPVTTDAWDRRARGAARPPRARQPTWSSSRPATADLLARAADRPRRTTCSPPTLLTARCPVLFAPAMHTEMWEHPATQANVAAAARPRRHRPGARGRPPDRRRHAARAGCRSRAGSARSRPALLARGPPGRRGPRAAAGWW